MASIQIRVNKKGVLTAKIQAYGKDAETGSSRFFVKTIKNEQGLSEARFRKKAELVALEYEEEIRELAAARIVAVKDNVLTFNELMREFVANIKRNLSVNYYERAVSVQKRFNEFLVENRLDKLPISEITVRHIQLYLNSFTSYKVQGEMVKLIKELPRKVNFRELARAGVINRNVSYRMNKLGLRVKKATAEAICKYYKLTFSDYYEEANEVRQYSVETVKGQRRILRAVFNEAVRYNWITKNPVCATKIGAGNHNTSLRAVKEKEVFSIKEAQEFIRILDNMSDEFIIKKIPLKFMLLTGVRTAEMCGIRWSDIDFANKVVHIVRNRLRSTEFGSYEKAPKTVTSAREIPLSDTLIKDLYKFYEWFKLADDDFDNKLDSYYLAVNIYRQPLSNGVLGRWLKSIEQENGLKEVSCHGLRHTYCSILIAQGVPIQTVSKYLGHSDSTITLEVYSHFLPDTKEKVVNVLDSLTD